MSPVVRDGLQLKKRKYYLTGDDLLAMNSQKPANYCLLLKKV